MFLKLTSGLVGIIGGMFILHFFFGVNYSTEDIKNAFLFGIFTWIIFLLLEISKTLEEVNAELSSIDRTLNKIWQQKE
jgi:hypothetical protein